MNEAILDLMMAIDADPALTELDNQLDAVFGLGGEPEADFMTRAMCADKLAKIMNSLGNYENEVHPEDIFGLVNYVKEKGVNTIQDELRNSARKTAEERLKRLNKEIFDLLDECESLKKFLSR